MVLEVRGISLNNFPGNIILVMFKDLLGDYEPRGKTIQGIGKFIALDIDDPFHITTVAGFTIYGIGKLIERRSNYGLRRAKLDIIEIRRQIRELILDITTMKIR